MKTHHVQVLMLTESERAHCTTTACGRQTDKSPRWASEPLWVTCVACQRVLRANAERTLAALRTTEVAK